MKTATHTRVRIQSSAAFPAKNFMYTTEMAGKPALLPDHV